MISDVDGCLLDLHTYRAGPARPVLRRLRRHRVPVVLCTTKTRAEVRALGRELGGGPYVAIIEDGGGIFVPRGVLPALRLAGARRVRAGRLVTLAPEYTRIRRVFAQVRRHTAGAALGFGDMTVAEVAAVTGLAPDAARRARRREFDEPFLYRTDERRYARRVARLVARHGLVVTRGGRLWHLHGLTDKGLATRRVRELLQGVHGALTIIALGDSPLDAPLLAAADLPIIVPQPGGSPDPRLRRRLPRARIAPAPGPAGWARAVTRAVRELGVSG